MCALRSVAHSVNRFIVCFVFSQLSISFLKQCYRSLRPVHTWSGLKLDQSASNSHSMHIDHVDCVHTTKKGSSFAPIMLIKVHVK